MRRLLVLALAACGHAPPHHNAESFEALSNRVLDHLYHASPSFSVGLGFHDYDGKLPDITPAATAALIATYRADCTASLGGAVWDPCSIAGAGSSSALIRPRGSPLPWP